MPKAWFFYDLSKLAFTFAVIIAMTLAPSHASALCQTDGFEAGFLTAADIGSGDGEGLQRISEAIDAAREQTVETPFPAECQNEDVLRNRPKTGLFRREVPFTDGQGRSTRDFLNRVGTRVLEAMDKQEEDFALLQSCLNGQSKSKDCKLADRWLKEDLVPIVKMARMNLALAASQSHLANYRQVFSKTPLTRPNSSLETSGTMKETPWDPLTKEEQVEASEILKEYYSNSVPLAEQAIKSGKLKAGDRTAKNSFIQRSVFKENYIHARAYKSLLSKFPILQELKSANPSAKEVAEAIGKMRAHLAADKNFVLLAISANNEKMTPTRGRRDGIMPSEIRTSVNPDALGILEFKSFAAAELAKAPADCALATSLMYTSENRALGNALAMGVPLVVFSIATPFAGAYTSGPLFGLLASMAVSSGAGFAAYAKIDRDHVADRFMSKLADDCEADYANFDSADEALKFSVVFSLAPAVAGPAARVAAKSTSLAVKTTLRLFQKFRSEAPTDTP